MELIHEKDNIEIWSVKQGAKYLRIQSGENIIWYRIQKVHEIPLWGSIFYYEEERNQVISSKVVGDESKS